MSDPLTVELIALATVTFVFVLLTYGLLRGRWETMPLGRVSLLTPGFGLRDHYTLRIEIAETLAAIDIWPAEIPRLAAFLTSCDNGQGAALRLSSTDAAPARALLIPMWALPEVRRLISEAALSQQPDAYEYFRRPASA
ncbi:MAG TPA: hypothetical protein VMQ51_18745 [Candidatus Binatia bacterium]|nr:hypothetical protein [Candidatus Binatia bacterium]